jgi:hypothetical protein
MRSAAALLGHGLAISAAGGGEHNPPPRSRRRLPRSWFSRPSLQSRVVGFDVSGDPVVEASSKDVMEAWVVTSPDHGTKLLSLTPTAAQQNPNGPGRPALQSVVGDANGIWMATSDGLYFSASTRTEKVSTVTGQLGGGCA